MERHAKTTIRVLKRLKAAVGYYELGMSGQAATSLDSLETLGDIGHFRLVADVLRGEFAVRDSNTSIASALEFVAGILPAPGRRAVQMTLSTCFIAADDRETSRSDRNSTPSLEVNDASSVAE